MRFAPQTIPAPVLPLSVSARWHDHLHDLAASRSILQKVFDKTEGTG